ncbi:MAG: STAS/SEC14 domain-containing protein, partial [Verrucomicrobia subdivision 3 bacterium]|nr:STAS/SEC14 domain-containing protein [Limisphaerales bacterium]
KFATQHCRDVERVALVGERKWEEWMAKVCKPFTLAKLRYFDIADIESAWQWLSEPD